MSARELIPVVGHDRLPSILQTETAECGLACLAMVASYYGARMDLATLRREYALFPRGANLKQLIAAAERLDMTTRALRVELEDLPRLRAPAILHWNLNHYVVLKKATRRGIVVHDPAVGRRRYSMEEASRHFTGIALELVPGAEFQPADRVKRLRLRDFWRSSSGLPASIAQLVLLSFVLQLFTVLSPLYLQVVVDEALVKYDADLLVVLAIGFLLVMLIRSGTGLLRGYVALHMGATLSFQMAVNLFRHLIRLPLDYFERRHIGDVLSRFGSVEKVRQMLTEGVIAALLDGLMVLVTLAMMYVYSPLLATIALVAVGLYLVFRLLRLPYERMRAEEEIVAAARQETVFMESVRSLLSIKTFAREPQRENLWQNSYADTMNAGIRLRKFSLNVDLANSMLFGAENVLVIYLAGTMVFEGQLSIGMLFAFVSYKRQFSAAVTSLVDTAIGFRLLGVHLERMADIAFTPREFELKGASHFHIAFRGGLGLERVSYRYGTGEPWILKDVDLAVSPGEWVAIVGASGSGKTTLLKVLMGLFAPHSGCARVDGEKLADLGIESYRARIAAVTQGDTLMSGTIAENICFFDTLPDPGRIERAARLACIHEEIQRMPMKYETLVGDLGANMSYGQRQRVLIARALYAEPTILFLDEATSHVDLAAETAILRNIRELGATLLVISHRPEVVAAADRVLQVTDGSVVQAPQGGLGELEPAAAS